MGQALRLGPKDRLNRQTPKDSSPIASRVCLAGARLSAIALQQLPRRFVFWGSDRVADIAFVLSRSYRPNAIDNFRGVLGPDASESILRKTALEAFRASSRCSAELLLLQGRDNGALSRSVRFVEGNWSLFDDLVGRGRGVVLLTAHLGAYDCLSQLIASRGHRVTIVVGRTMSRPKFDAAVALRRVGGVNVSEATPQAVRSMVETLRRGECVAFLGDRDFFGNGTPVEFFSHSTTLPSSAVRIARETGAPILAGYLLRSATGYDLVLEEPFDVARTADRHADIARGMERVVASLTRSVSRAPEQWAVFQRVWPDSK